MTDLQKLIEAVETGALWAAYEEPTTWPPDVRENAKGAFSGSLDAAKLLHEALLPGAWLCIYSPAEPFSQWFVNMEGQDSSFADTPARAWLLAILRAVSATDTKEGR